MNNRIVLINPPYPVSDFPSPPLGLISLGSFLKNNGYNVFIDDLVVNSFSPGRVMEILKNFKPRYAGITGATMNIKKSLEVLSCYRELAPHLVTVAGGPHVTFDAEAVLRENSHLDYIVRGEGEFTLLRLLEAIENKEELAGIDGLSYRDGENPVHNRDRDFISDINILPLPDPRLGEPGKYRALGMPVNMTTSRGCPHRCIFCVGRRMVGNRVRYFDVKRVVDEFQALSETGARQINIADDLFTSNKTRCIEICNEILKRGIRQEWTAFARVDTVSEELLFIMKKAGCTTLCFGIESGNQEILDRARKKTDLKMCREAISMCQKAGIKAMTAYILGLPGETAETLKKTVEFSRNLSQQYGYHILAPLPGSEVRDRSADYGIRILSSDWDLYDAKHAVSESVYLDSKEVERVASDFKSGIERMVKHIEKKALNGDEISESDRSMLENRARLFFVSNLIFSDVLDDFNSNFKSTGVDPVHDLVDYLSGVLPGDRDFIRREVDHMIKNNCIQIELRDDNINVSWL